MRTFDFSPLYRSTVGFDRLASLLDSVAQDTAQPGYPPYNIELTGENEYRITMAVAGFAEDDLSLEAKQNLLTISGNREQKSDAKFLHQGIAARSFERRFQLADHVNVAGAKLENGLLHVDLVREIPEEMRPRQIAIQSGKSGKETIEGKAEAA